MQQQLDMLQKQMQVVEQFEKLFNSTNPQDFDTNLGSAKLPDTFVHFMQGDSAKKAALAFGDSQLSRVTRVLENIKGSTFEEDHEIKSKDNETRSFAFVNLSITAMKEYIGTKNPANEYILRKDKAIMQLRTNVSELIAAKKAAVQKAIDEVALQRKTESKEKIATTVAAALTIAKFSKSPDMKRKVEEKRNSNKAKMIAEEHSALEAKKQFRKKCARYTGAAVLATGGTAAIAFSTLMQFGPQFAMLASLNLPPVALAAVAVSGVAMVAAAAYVAYRTYKPAPVVMSDAPETSVIASPAIATNYSKFLPHVLATMGTGMVGFSALMQFSPKVALLMGLHLTPAALMSVAAVGVLLISASLYLACKAYAKSRVVATDDSVMDTATSSVANADTTVQDKPSCMQTLSTYTATATARCFKFFSRSTTNVANDTSAQLNAHDTHKATV